MTARCVSRCCFGLAWYWSGTGAAGPHGGAEPVLTLHGVEIVLHFSEHPVTPSPGRNTPPWPRGPRPLWEQKSQQGRARRTQIFGSGGAAVCGRQPPAPEPGVVTHAGDFRRDPEGCRRRPVPASHPPPAPRLTCAPGPWGRRSGPGLPGVSAGCPSPLGASPVLYPPHSLPREVTQVRSKGHSFGGESEGGVQDPLPWPSVPPTHTQVGRCPQSLASATTTLCRAGTRPRVG